MARGRRGGVACKRPVSRAQVSARGGVDGDTGCRTLAQGGYIAGVSRDPGPGNALMFGTTREFLVRMGIDRLADLPSLGDFVPGPEVVEALERGLLAGPDVVDAAVPVDDRS